MVTSRIVADVATWIPTAKERLVAQRVDGGWRHDDAVSVAEALTARAFDGDEPQDGNRVLEFLDDGRSVGRVWIHRRPDTRTAHLMLLEPATKDRADHRDLANALAAMLSDGGVGR